jgi:1-deoxy-D-xylulose-5-phosphate reductoisomerase
MAGPVFMRAVRESGATLLPIDSEHNAIFQSLPSNYSGDLAESGVLGLFLTASGGPFRGMALTDSSPSALSRPAPIRTGSWDERYRSIARR